MATLETAKKVHYIGVWLEDVFTDQIVQNIAAHAKASKGKKVKMVLNASGLRIKQSRWFHEKITEYYPLISIKTITRNPVLTYCVMVILADPKKKYRVLALKCASEAEAIHLCSMYAQIRRDSMPANVELKKRGNGNWTLRDRSTHNANRHLAEIFSEQQETDEQNDELEIEEEPNGDVANHVPILDESKVINTESTVKAHTGYITRNAMHNNNNNNSNNNSTKASRDYDEVYTIETEVSNETFEKPLTSPSAVYVSQPSGQPPPPEPKVTAFRGDLDHLTNEVRDIKTLLVNMQASDQTDGTNVSPSKPREPIYANASMYSEPVVYRTLPRNYEATQVRRQIPDPWASHRRLSGNFILPAQLNRQLRSGRPTDSVRSSHSARVKFDNESVKSGGSVISRLRLRKAVPSTIPRPIEQAYGRQTLTSRHNSLSNLASRPVSVRHVVGKNELALYHDPSHHYMDVAL